MSVLVLGEDEVRATLDMPRCIEAMEGVLAALAREEVSMPLRTIFRVPDEAVLGLGLMPAHRAGDTPVKSQGSPSESVSTPMVSKRHGSTVSGPVLVISFTPGESARTKLACGGASPPQAAMARNAAPSCTLSKTAEACAPR